MIDILSGCLAGAATSPEISGDPAGSEPQRTGHLVIALDVRSFRDRDAFAGCVSALVESVHGAPRRDDAPAFRAPGEPEAATRRSRGDSIPFEAGDLELLRTLGQSFGTPFPEV